MAGSSLRWTAISSSPGARAAARPASCATPRAPPARSATTNRCVPSSAAVRAGSDAALPSDTAATAPPGPAAVAASGAPDPAMPA